MVLTEFAFSRPADAHNTKDCGAGCPHKILNHGCRRAAVIARPPQAAVAISL